MDGKTQTLLNDWGLSLYKESFKDQFIEYESLKDLKEQDLINLFQNKIGLVRRFQRKLAEHLANPLSVQEARSTSVEISERQVNLNDPIKIEELDLATFDSNIGMELARLDPEEDPLERLPKQHMRHTGSIQLREFEVDESTVIFSLEPVEGSTSVFELTECNTTCIASTSQGSSFASSVASTSRGASHSRTSKASMTPLKRLHASEIEYDLEFSDTLQSGPQTPSTPLRKVTSAVTPSKRARCRLSDGNGGNIASIPEENIVEHYLRRNCVGRAILQLQVDKKPLDDACRAKLAHEVIVSEVGCDGCKQIGRERFEILVESIVALFPGEIKETYFIPRKPAHGAEQAVQPKGLLYDKYHNLLKFLRKAGLRNSIRPQNEVHVQDPSCTDPAVAADMQWLSDHSLESRQLTEEKWRRTAKYRIADIQNTVDSVAKTKITSDLVEAYVQRFSCLSQKWGSKLILQDFEYLYGGKFCPIIENWQVIHSRILTLAGKTDEEIPLSATVKCLKLIPGLFKQPIMIYGSGQRRQSWKPNTVDSSKGFLLHVKDVGDLEAEIESMKAKCGSVKKSLQPFPAVVGITEEEISASYVVIGSLRFCVESPLKAIDTCFKLYHALHCHYPYQSSYAWLFLQQAVYGLKTDWDFSAPAVNTKVRTYKQINFNDSF